MSCLLGDLLALHIVCISTSQGQMSYLLGGLLTVHIVCISTHGVKCHDYLVTS
jgi:hypothetical protein